MTLASGSGRQPGFAQMYFSENDPVAIVARRQEVVHLEGVRGSAAVIERLERVIRAHHPFYNAVAPVVNEWRQV